VNKVLGFIKGNLIIVISIVLVLALLPVGYVFSSKWNAKVSEKVKGAYDTEKRSLTSSGRVNYALPAVLDGEQDLSESRAPNDAVTAFYEDAKQARIAQVEDVVERGTSFNQGDHVEIVPGLLPAAPNARDRQRLGRSMSEAIVGTPDTPSVYQRKLRRINAGAPPSVPSLATMLDQYKIQLEQEYSSANAQGQVSQDQQEEIKDKLTARRLNEYISRAKSLTYYCSPIAFVNGSATGELTTVDRDGHSIVPAQNWPPSQVTETVAYTWLWDFWVISDILDAAAQANMNAASGTMPIPDATVKRIESIRVSALEVEADESDQDGFGGGRPSGGFGDPEVVEESSFTGREGGTASSPFDLRQVELSAVVASEDLPKFLDAFSQVNFMTVTDVDLQEVDVWADLQDGYYYGTDHVVRANVKIETVWLRSWMSPIMPDPVKQALGIPVMNPDDGG
jgi:hypothetical protein